MKGELNDRRGGEELCRTVDCQLSVGREETPARILHLKGNPAMILLKMGPSESTWAVPRGTVVHAALDPERTNYYEGVTNIFRN